MTDRDTGAPDFDELVAAGLIDPGAADADERRLLVDWLTSRGFTIEEMAAAHAAGDLAALAGDSLHRTGVTLSLADMAARTEMPLELLVDVRRTAGLAPIGVDVPVFTEDDVAAYLVMRDASTLFSWSELMSFLRVVGSSMGRIADAANTLFLHDVEGPMVAAGATELDLAHRGMQAMVLASQVSAVLSMLLRQHLDQSIGWSRRAHSHAMGPGLVVPMAVGFVDLVGFTPRATTLDPSELAELVSRFEATAHDVVTELDGRLVKLIGDEVMFVAVERERGCEIALRLLTAFGEDPALTPRGGLAYGNVLTRAGDFFGPTVNLAARLAEQAVPGEVLATPDAVTGAGVHHVEPAGRRLLKGFADPVSLVSLTA